MQVKFSSPKPAPVDPDTFKAGTLFEATLDGASVLIVKVTGSEYIRLGCGNDDWMGPTGSNTGWPGIWQNPRVLAKGETVTITA